ncbi:MAG TPA: 50S ribosomal protein L6 [Thermoplasmataceae archaeon]|nr:50S ribosomal protein L6 [Thermoplasmataceae archaeon]
MIKWTESWSLEIPSGVQASLHDGVLKMKGKNGEVTRTLLNNYVRLEADKGKIRILSSKNNRLVKGIVGTWASEVRNLVEGVQNGFQYEMKIDYTHFPIRVTVKGDSVVIDNFLGERSPRVARIVGSTKASVKGDRIFLTGPDKREIGETAANIERATRIKGFDLRVFQDGIYLL